MLLKKLYLSVAFAVSLSHAEVNWKPQFKDKPVSVEMKQAIEAALPDQPIVQPKAARRILIYSATAGFRHQSIPTGKEALTRLGLTTGAYEAIVSDDPENFEQAALKTFDTVVLLNPTQDFFMPNNERKKEFSSEEWSQLKARHNRLVDNLIAYVENGGGLMGIHAATDSCYNHPEYGEMIGGYFDGHPWRKDDEVTIVVEDPEHGTIKPVFGSITEFNLIEEIYQFKPEPYSRDKLRILLHLDPAKSAQVKNLKRKDNDYAVAWVQAVGKGRVFYSTIGHNHAMYTNPLILNHYLAGIQFACGDLEADTTPSNQISMPNMEAPSLGK